MNDQQAQMLNQSTQMMNQPPPPAMPVPPLQQMMSMSQPPHVLNPTPQQQVMNQNNRQEVIMMNMNQLHPPQVMNQNHMMINRNQLQMMNRNYGMWPPPPVDPMKFQNLMMNQAGFVPGPMQSKLKPLGGGRGNWKGKKGIDGRKDGRRKDNVVLAGSSSSGVAIGGGGMAGYKPPSLNDLQFQNRLKARKFYQKKKFNNSNDTNSNNNRFAPNNNNTKSNNNRFAPYAPRNTTSFIIRAKKSGGIASLVSPCPVTPAVLPTPIFSPSREVLVDMAKEEWGVDGYGSMKGLIRLRSPGHEMDAHEEEEEEEGGGSSESDVEEHVEVERRLDHDLSRFEMIYPNYGNEHNNVLENRVDDQDAHIAQLEEENLILKERLFLMARELDDLRRRLQSLERQNHGVDEVNEEVVENESENESASRSIEENNEEVVEENNEGGEDVEVKEEINNVDTNKRGHSKIGSVTSEDVCMEDSAHTLDGMTAEKDGMFAENRTIDEEDNGTKDVRDGGINDEGTGNECSEKTIGDGDLSNCPVLIGKVQTLHLSGASE